uniref:LRR receptor-like serine/threonine-protein kinase FLS2 n=1 Tax=Cajanus cajan TaxID=3821 RepID=A0A151RJY3_CAJCA|nr:LRR receptor-like serine/threonine-protein kinase FLS2 [Cajanus cajan]
MKLKHHLIDPSNRLSSWNHNNSNCCQWPLVVCNNVTAHVLQLHLNTSPPTPEIYEYYEFDDLIFEDEEAYYEAIVAYERSQIGGEINPCLGDLKHLNYLDLSGNYLLGQDWLSSLSKLEYLDLGYTNLSKSFHWLQAVGSLSSLKHLYLRGCRLPLPHYSQPSALNFTSLLTLDMSDTSLFSFVPKWIFGLAKLVSLQLRGNNIQGPIPDGIQNLTLLQNLDLFSNSFSSSIPNGLYSLRHLKFLNLAENNLNGSISNALGNLTSLVGLHLSDNQLEGKLPTSLGILDSIPTWFWGTFSQAIYVNLSHNHIHGTFPAFLKKINPLISLDLGENNFSGNIPTWIGERLLNIKILRLRSNKFSGNLTDEIGVFKNIVRLDFSDNLIGGALPISFEKLSSLKSLHLSENHFRGNPFENLRSLSNLTYLSIYDNLFQGILKEDDLANLMRLKYFMAQGSNLTLKVGPNWHPNFQLNYLDMSSWQLGPNFPSWLLSQNKPKVIDISNTGILDSIPTWFWRTCSQAFYVNLSHNHIFAKLQFLQIRNNSLSGTLPTTLKKNIQLISLDLGENNLTGTIPMWVGERFINLRILGFRSNNFSGHIPNEICGMSHLQVLDLAHNKLSGNIPSWILDSIPTWFWGTFSQASYVNLSHNHIHSKLVTTIRNPLSTKIVDLSTNHLCGKLPYLSRNVKWLDISSNSFSGPMNDFLCNKQFEQFGLNLLNLASNNLSGKIPDCWIKWPNLMDVNLQSNNFVGNLPPSMGSLAILKSCNIRNNSLSGTFPVFLKNNNELISLDLGKNNYSGEIPTWIGERLLNIKILRLRSNKFSGHIPNEIYLFIYSEEDFYMGHKYKSILGLVTNIDLSNNNLSGGIPTEITYLDGLIYLKLSKNQLTGQIPPSAGNMRSLESMDISKNQLSGEIPPTIANLSFLNELDVSYNHLKGQIPTGTQIQSFEASNFVGNNLCGPPLPINCSFNKQISSVKRIRTEDDGHEVNWFFVSMTLGFVVVFCIVVAPLFIYKSWRYVYFYFLDDMLYKMQSYW